MTALVSDKGVVRLYQADVETQDISVDDANELIAKNLAYVYLDEGQLWLRPGVALCEACGEEAFAHAAHVQIWQIGDRWVPSCSDRVTSWWNDAGDSIPDRVSAGAPADWIRPLPEST